MPTTLRHIGPRPVETLRAALSADRAIISAEAFRRTPGADAGSGGVHVAIHGRSADTGARAAAVVAGPDPHRAAFPVTRERLLGFRDASGDVGVDWTDSLVAVSSTNDARQAQTMTANLMSRARRPDAIATMSDDLASGALRAQAAAGLQVLSDVAVTGFDRTQGLIV